MSKTKSYWMHELNLTNNEVIHEKTRVWSLDFRYFWITVISILILYLIPISLVFKILILPVIIWYGLYSFRQKWNLTLTNKRIVARRLYPRPLNYFLTKIKNYPFQHIEGLSTGPKNNITLFLVGLFVGASIGINLLKTSLTAGSLDLPDTLEFFIFIMKNIPFLRNDALFLESELDDYYRLVARNLFVILGTGMLIFGILLILVSFPWKNYLVIRIRYGRDFRLRAGISSEFIDKFYERLYKLKVVKAPKKFQKWHFSWLEGEEVEGVADLEQNLYLNRIIGLFAIIVGSLRIWHGAKDLQNFNSITFILWLIVASSDLLIAFLSVKFSKRTNEMIITNRRIIFAQEVKQLSGSYGRRLFYISDLKRHDIANFEFRKVTAYAFEYIITALVVSYFGIVLLLATPFGWFSILPFLLISFSVILFLFVNQTYVSFTLKTKSGDKWVMRHQLANPATRLRQFVGDESSLFSRLLTNRLEEKEIINAVQILRASDLNLEARKFEKTIENEIREIKSKSGEQSEDPLEQDHLMDESNRNKKKRKIRVQLSIDDILLKDEAIVWEKKIPVPINRRKISLIFGGLAYLLFLPLVFFIAFRVNISLINDYIRIISVDIGLLFICGIISAIVFILFLLKYYSLRRRSIIITKERIFFEEIVRPPKILFFLGIFRESYIKESLIEYLQNLKSGKYSLNRLNLNHAKNYLTKAVIWLGTYLIAVYLYLMTRSEWKFLPASGNIEFAFRFIILTTGLIVAWNVANVVVQIIQSWPSIELEAVGIGINFILPYLNLNEAQRAQVIIWSGIGPEDRLKERLRLKRALAKQRKLKTKTR